MWVRAGIAAVLVTVALLPGVAVAKDSPVLEEAKALASKGDLVKAAERFGDAVAAAQTAGDLQAEQAAADSFAAFVDSREPKPSDPAPAAGTPTVASLLAAVMRKLDANRLGAFVSAPMLARNVLRLSTESGEFASVADAARVLAAHATKPSSGKAAVAYGKYAEGLTAVAAGKFDQATAPLGAAVAAAIEDGWFDLATHASVEEAAAWVKQSSPAKATDAISNAASGLDVSAGIKMITQWMQMVQKRLPDGPKDIAKPLDNLKERIGEGASSSAMAAGGKGAPAGGSDIAKLLPKLAKGKPFASVAFTGGGFEFQWATKPDKGQVADADWSIATSADEGGVSIGLHGRSVALLMVDLVGNKGASTRHPPSLARAFYVLADGETWGVSKEGVVTITKK